MAAVVRIKRRLDEDPLESLVLNCKRRKTTGNEQSGPEDLSAVLRLAGTSQQEENIETLLRKHRLADKSELQEQFKRHSVNINEKNRSDSKEASKNSRYKVVNCFRKSLSNQEGDSEQAASTSASEVTVFDIETETSNSQSVEASEVHAGTHFVYDFYYTSSDDFGEADIEDYVSVYPLNDPLVFGSVKENGLEEPSEDESEDSNAESNWKNDYPDEDDLVSINEEDMIQAVKNLNIEEDLLSSDSGEDEFVYSRDEEDFQDEEGAVDKQDELLYGNQYAKFKAKNKNVLTAGLTSDFYYGDIDEDEYVY